MADIPEVEAQRLPTGDRIQILRFDGQHERTRLGPHRHRDLQLMYSSAVAALIASVTAPTTPLRATCCC